MDTPHLDEIARGLEQLALKVVMLAEDDLPGLGAFLLDLEGLRAGVAACRAEDAARALDCMIQMGNRLALQEVEAAAQALNLLGQGVALLQEWAKTGQWPATPEARAVCQQLAGGPGGTEAAAAAEPEGKAPAWDDPELVAGFLAEAREHLEGIETRLVHLEQNPQDLEAVNGIFRPFHTIKGVAGFLNLAQIQETAHEVESLLDRVRGGHLPVTPGLVDVVLAGVDLLKDMLADLEEALAASRGLASFDLRGLKEGIRGLCREEPPVPRLGNILVGQGELQPDELAIALKSQKLTEPRRPLGEILVEGGQVAPKKVARALVQQLSETKGSGEAAAPTIKVDLARVDTLVDLMGELVILESQVKQSPSLVRVADQKLMRDLSQMARITTDLQRITMSLRMVPIVATFRKMVRLVRDLSHKVQKQVHLNLVGEETEIDRNMVEAIYDPLVHLVRNSVDHGLEAPAERQAGGKPPEGQLWLRAYNKGGSVIIEIEDDGRGLNREAILARARERGLVDEGETLTPGAVDHLIFEPGFSTAKEVTEVSGRGVGLDVVKQTAERLRGKIEIASRPGEGSLFTLRLPLTLALIEGLVLRVGRERYILPAAGVRETLRPGPGDYFTVAGKGELIQVRKQLLPLMRLHRLFQVGDQDVPPGEALVLVAEHEGETRALLVDEILDKQEVVIKSLGPICQRLPGLAGGTILGDGRVGLILDLAGLFALEAAA